MKHKDSEPMTVAAGLAASWDKFDPRLRAALEARDGPYQRRQCTSCGAEVVVGRTGCRMLDSGEADAIICTGCMVEMVRRIEAEAFK